MRAPRVVYISSLSHSGSTVLDLLLGSVPGAVSLGEVGQMAQGPRSDLDHLRARRCTCGATGAECPMWSLVLARRATTDRPGDLQSFYTDVLAAGVEAFGPDVVLVDSSKFRRPLAAVQAAGAQVDVIRLVRDVRGWSYASRRRERAAERRVRPWPRLFDYWYRANRALDEVAASAGGPSLVLGYEELVLEFGVSRERLAGVLGVAATEIAPTTADATAHQLFGNPMRHDEQLRSVLQYDAAWMAALSWLPWAAVLVPVMRYNRAHVYSGARPDHWVGARSPHGTAPAS